MAPMGCILFLHSNSTYFAKSVLLTLASHRGEMRKPVYCPVRYAYEKRISAGKQKVGHKYGILKKRIVLFLEY